MDSGMEVVYAVSNDGGKTGVAWREDVNAALDYLDLQNAGGPSGYSVVAIRRPAPARPSSLPDPMGDQVARAEKAARDAIDAHTVFTAISTGGFGNFQEAEQAVAMFYVGDPSFSRAGICLALKKLEQFYGARQVSAKESREEA
jgi:hypothetical protein